MELKRVFIFGMRRSGTTALLNLVCDMYPHGTKFFEPHELFFAVQAYAIKRYRQRSVARTLLERFDRVRFPIVKIPINPGYYELGWTFFLKKYPNAKFIFITRDLDETFMSRNRVDAESERGFVPLNIYRYFHKRNEDMFRAIAGNGRALLIENSELRDQKEEVKNRIRKYLG